jgi:hypothetical protein
MKNFLNRVFASRTAKAIAAAGAFASVAAVSATAGATGVITSAFASETTDLTAYMGLAAALVIVLLGLGVGIRLLVKWVKIAIAKN